MVTLLDGYSTSNCNSFFDLCAVHPSSTNWASACAQSFQVLGTEAKYKLIAAKFYLEKKTGNPTGHLIARLYNKTGTHGTDAKPTGSPLASSILVDIATLGSSPSLISFTFPSGQQYEMDKNAIFCIALEVYDGNVNINNDVGAGTDTSSPTHAGNFSAYANSVWQSFSNIDLCFFVYGEAVTPPPPGQATLTAQDGANGTISPPAGVYTYTQFTWSDWFTASPNSGYFFDHWEITFNGTHYHSSENPIHFYMYYNYTIQPVFSVIPPPPPTPSLPLVGAKLGGNLAVLLNDTVPMGGVEDFTTYTEFDPNNHIALDGTNHVDFQAYRSEDAYLYKDKGAGHFTDFEHKIDVKLVSAQSYALGYFWMVSNDVDDVNGLYTASKNFLCAIIYPYSGYWIALREYYNGTEYGSDVYEITLGTWYYLTIQKSGTAFTCKIYSDSARTNLLATLSLTLHEDTSKRYIWVCNTYNSGGAVWEDIDIENLNLQEAPVYESVKGKLVILV